MRYLHVWILLALIVTASSCEVDEQAIPKPAVKPGIESNELTMGNDYKYQIYFDFETNRAVSQNNKTAWDLGFECGTDGFHIILNSSKSMFVYNTHVTDFQGLTDTSGKLGPKLWDVPSGNLDSTAIGDWRNKNEIYVIDRGYNETGVHQGFKKIQFTQVDAQNYNVKMADINGSNMVQRDITKDDLYNFIFLSLSDGQVVTIEPPKDTWDVVFTQYTHVFDEDGTLMPYLVTGCLLNRYETAAFRDTLTSFDAVDLSSIDNESFSNDINSIGYDWKTYTGSTYVVNKKWNYIIRNRKGSYYKMHFISFFNANGEKGSPSFEFTVL